MYLPSAWPSQNMICRREEEVMKVLMHGMTGRLGTRVWGFVDQHGVHRHDIWSKKAFHISYHLYIYKKGNFS